MKCKLSTINGWCGIFNKSCKECISPKCEFIKKAYRQGRVEAEYFGYHKRKWIPVSERLPEEHGAYLVTFPSILKNKMCVDILRYGKPFMPNTEIKEVCWYDADAEYWDVVYDEVVAWMPLPTPYKGGDDE